MVKGRLSAVCGLLILGLGACGRSVRTADRAGDGDDSDSSGSSGVAAGGSDAGPSAGMGGGGGSSSGSAGAGGAGSSSIAGSTSGAGAPPITDAEVCADACMQTRFHIPSALCEDWHFPDDHTAEYCGSFEATECTSRCEAQLGYVSAPCNDALRQAIPCVARSDLYHGGAIPPPHPCGYIAECIRELLRVSAECNGLRGELARARALWATEGSDTYSYTLRRGTSTFDILVSDGIPSVVRGSLPDPPTIPTLFDHIEASFESAPASATYDAQLGYPREASFLFQSCVGLPNDLSFGVADLTLE